MSTQPIPETFFESIAIPLVNRGWDVAPCYPNDKQVHTKLVPSPLTMKTKSIIKIQKWASVEPFANVAVYAEQKEGGLLFLDKDGAISLRNKYEQETGKKFPQTLLVRSSIVSDGNGGTYSKGHWYFLQTTRTRALSKNISELSTSGMFSLRVKNEYVTSIGSIHPDTGKPYEIAEDYPVQPMPDDLLDWLLRQVVTGVDKPADKPAETRKLIPHGQIHPWMLTEAGRLRRNGLNADEIEPVLLRKVHENCAPPIDDTKVVAMAKSICNFPEGENKDLALTQEKIFTVQAGDGPTPSLSLETDDIPAFDESAITGIYRDIVDAATNGTTIPRQYAFLAAKVYIGAMIAGKVTFEGMEDTSSYYGVPIGLTGTGKGLAWKRVVDDILHMSKLAPSVKILEGSGDSGAGLKDFFFDEPRNAPVVCMIDEAISLGHKAGEKKNPEILDTIVELATKHKFTRAKAARGKGKAGRTHDNAHLSIYVCAQDKDVIAAAFPNRRGMGLFERFYGEYSAPIIAGRLPKVDMLVATKIWDAVQKLAKSGHMTMAAGVEERIESYWVSLPGDVQTKVRLKAHLFRDMYMAAHGRGSMIAEMQDLDSALVNFPRQIKIRETFFTTEVPDKIGLYLSRLKSITEGMRRRLNSGEPVGAVAVSHRDLQTETLAYKNNELHFFQTAWRSWESQMVPVKVKKANGHEYDKFIPKPWEHEEDVWK